MGFFSYLPTKIIVATYRALRMFIPFFPILKDLKKYIQFDVRREIHGWLRIINYYKYFIFIALIGIGYIATTIHLRPPEKYFIGSGRATSVYSTISSNLVKKFDAYGLSLVAINTSGRLDEFEKLKSEKSPISASFYVAGTASSKEYKNLESLGSIGYAPLWFFSRGNLEEKEDPFDALSNKKIGIGSSGSISNKLFYQFEELHNKTSKHNVNIITSSHDEAAELLRKGEIDGLFIVDAFESALVQSLIKDPSIHLHSFGLSDAYIAKFPFLTKVTIPKGAFDIDTIRPSNNITLLSSTISLLIEKNTHRAIQWALLSAAEDVSLDDTGFFLEQGKFPKYLDKSFPLSEVAARYYKAGMPTVFNYFPLWIASIIDYIWIYILALFLIISPMVKAIGKLRSFNSTKHVDYLFSKSRYAQDKINSTNDPIELEQEIQTVDKIMQISQDSWVSYSDMNRFFSINRSLIDIKNKANTKLNELLNKKEDNSLLNPIIIEDNNSFNIHPILDDQEEE
jgi:uncharacterized protein